MKLCYNENITKDIINRYYKKYEDIDCELEITCGTSSAPAIGRSVVQSSFPSISFRLKGTMEINGEAMAVEVPLSESEVENAMVTMIEETGRKVNSVSINFSEKGFNYVTVDAVYKRKVK